MGTADCKRWTANGGLRIVDGTTKLKSEIQYQKLRHYKQKHLRITVRNLLEKFGKGRKLFKCSKFYTPHTQVFNSASVYVYKLSELFQTDFWQ